MGSNLSLRGGGGFGETILEILSALGAIIGLQRAIDRYTITERL